MAEKPFRDRKHLLESFTRQVIEEIKTESFTVPDARLPKGSLKPRLFILTSDDFASPIFRPTRQDSFGAT